MNKNNLITSLLISSLLFFTGCGGSSIEVADGGITGTGITMGRITNFGSIIVNGIKFDVDNATFTRDGLNSQQSEYRVGEIVTILGSVDANGIAGIATSVTFSDSLEGEVTQVSTNGVTIEILGQTINTDQLAVFHGFNNLSELTVGNVVEVSGLKDATGVITATSIQLKQNAFVVGITENEIKGIVSNVNQAQMTFQVNNLTIDFSNATLKKFPSNLLVAGQFIEAKSNQVIENNTFVAFEVELEEEQQLPPSTNEEIEIEGLITRFASSLDFDVSGLRVTTNNSTEYKKGSQSDLILNTLIEVEGRTNSSGILVAEEIKFKSIKINSENSGGNNQSGGNDQSDGDGQSDDNDQSGDDEQSSDDEQSGSDDQSSGDEQSDGDDQSDDDEQSGDDDQSDGEDSDENDENASIKIEDIIQSIDIANNEITVANKIIILDLSTIMIDKSDLEVSPLTISALQVGDKVDVRGIIQANGKVLASRLERDD
jgi:hypothetical protein